MPVSLHIALHERKRYLLVVIVGGEGREARGPRGDRDDYRRKEGASGDFKPEFRGGFGKCLAAIILFWRLTVY